MTCSVAAGVITRNYVTRNYVQNVIDSLDPKILLKVVLPSILHLFFVYLSSDNTPHFTTARTQAISDQV